VNQLSALMQQLLDYGRPPGIQTSRGTIDAAALPPIERLTPRADGAGVRLENRIPPGLPPILMDRERIIQVFQNLVENSLQHTPAGGLIRVSAGEVTGHGRRWIECRVEDSGPGFAPGDLPRIFEPFFSQRHGGTGLGLSIAQRIVEQHGGTVRARNLPEGGAAVAFLLPVTEG
jgi:signal transduction histidine kinase